MHVHVANCMSSTRIIATAICGVCARVYILFHAYMSAYANPLSLSVHKHKTVIII